MDKKDVLIIHGTDYKNMAKQLLEGADLAAEIGRKDKRIALKPNLNVPRAASGGATTHPELLAGAIEYLQEHGFTDISIMESSWVGARTADAIRAAGYDKLCREYDVPFYDLQKDSYTQHDACGMQIDVCDKVAAVEYMINVPVLKGHCQTTVTCAMKNNKGAIPAGEKRRFHTMGLHKPIAHLNTVVRNDFILVDNICGDLDFEEGGNPVVMNRVLGFRDPVLCDAYVCSVMGYDVREAAYIGMAEKLGVGSADLSKANIIHLNPPDKETPSKLPMTHRVKALAGYVSQKDACSACYGSLIYALDRMKDAGQLGRRMPELCIGQGYKGQPGRPGALGIGRCTACFERSLAGCPPSAAEILAFLRENVYNG